MNHSQRRWDRARTYRHAFRIIPRITKCRNAQEVKEEMARQGYPELDHCFAHRNFVSMVEGACRGEYDHLRIGVDPRD